MQTGRRIGRVFVGFGRGVRVGRWCREEENKEEICGICGFSESGLGWGRWLQ